MYLKHTIITMAKNWYKKSMPTVDQVTPFIQEIAQTIKNINGVKEVLVWGSFLKNIKVGNFVIKDIDLIAVNDFYSEDLLSINETEPSTFKMSSTQLEDEGFDPASVNFTKQYISLTKYNIDHWAISKNDRLLHWGPVPRNKEDWKDIKVEAEKYASFMTGVNRRKLRKSSQTMRNKWSVLHDHYVNKNLSHMPYGWYQSSHNIEEILPETLKLV